jgi:trehalose 6-phosphate phosphatase
VEDKGTSLVVHYRAAADGARAEGELAPALRRIARDHGLSLLAAKKAIELTGGPVPGKGAVVRDLVSVEAVNGCLYAGDDVADIDAFEALARLRDQGMPIVRVAVRSEETPGRLIEAADVVVDRPSGLVRLLSEL